MCDVNLSKVLLFIEVKEIIPHTKDEPHCMCMQLNFMSAGCGWDSKRRRSWGRKLDCGWIGGG